MVATATELGAVVRWVRGERRVPMEDTAARSGVSRDLLRDLERAARGVNLAQALDVFASFGIDVVLVPRDRSLTMRDPRDLPTTAPTLRRGPRPTVADSVAVFLDGRRVNVAKPGQQAHPLWAYSAPVAHSSLPYSQWHLVAPRLPQCVEVRRSAAWRSGLACARCARGGCARSPGPNRTYMS